ncbi:MAG: PAS domain S-box protein, partial [Planctomycetales bacterium]|nr:PAS domain S-box protein [Planctomycetales bacterium]
MTEPSHSLRGRAKAMLQSSLKDVAEMPAAEVQRLLHELQVHQLELEIQNEELRRAQFELAQSRDRYSDLYDFAPVGYLTLDARGVIQEANLTAAAMLGVDRQHLNGHKFSSFVSQDSQDAWHLHCRKVFDNAERAGCELRMIVADQSSSVFRLECLAVPNSRGQVDRCRITISDVTDRRIAYDALAALNINLDKKVGDTTSELAQSIEKLRLLSEAVAHLGEGVMITGDDLDWPGPKIVFVNEAMCQMAGYTADELIGRAPRKLQGEGTDRKALEKIHNDLLESGSCVAELVNYRKDGTPYDVELFITPLFDASGRRTNFVSIQRDITERKAIAEALRQEHELSSTILKTSQNVTLVLNPQGHIELFNPYLEKITGYRFDEVKGKDWFDTFVPDLDRDTMRRLFSLAIAGNVTRGNVNPILTKDGRRRFIEWYDAPLTDSDGQLVGLLCSGQDVTDRLDMERHILDVASEEQRRIGTDLHDGVGQELTGLSMIADTLMIALSREDKPELKIAERIREGLQRALAQVRALSRGLNPVDVDSAGLMSSLAEMTARLSQLYGVTCEFRCEQSVLLADNQTATQLYRIAQEATTNAIRHAQPTQIVISLTCTKNVVTLRVVDNGSGIVESESPLGMGLRTMRYRA